MEHIDTELEIFGGFEIGWQAIYTVKYADEDGQDMSFDWRNRTLLEESSLQ